MALKHLSKHVGKFVEYYYIVAAIDTMTTELEAWNLDRNIPGATRRSSRVPHCIST